jgi:hypothetical protein
MRASRIVGSMLCVLALPALAGAQTATPKISYGILGGVNLATATGSDIPNKANLVAYAFGGFVRFPFDANWAIQTGVEYSVKGVKATDETVSPPVDMKLELKYIEVPVFLRGMTDLDPKVKWYGELGPVFSFKSACTVTGTQGGVSVSMNCSDLGSFKSYDIGAAFGTGLEFPVNEQAFLVGARYNLGLVNVSDQGTNKNRTLQFLVGWKF